MMAAVQGHIGTLTIRRVMSVAGGPAPIMRELAVLGIHVLAGSIMTRQVWPAADSHHDDLAQRSGCEARASCILPRSSRMPYDPAQSAPGNGMLRRRVMGSRAPTSVAAQARRRQRRRRVIL